MFSRIVTVFLITGLVTLGLMPGASADSIQIPKIHVNAPIVPVGVANGSLAVGRNLHAIYRWREGVKPCKPGRFLLAGHTYEGGSAVLNNLGKLRRNDLIHITRPGKDCTYKITSSRLQRASVSVRSCHNFDGLHSTGCIVTCVGRVGPGVYTHRRVVRFRMVQDQE